MDTIDRITAPCVFDGPINAACFLAWVRQFLAPTLNPIEQVFAKLKRLLRRTGERTKEVI